MNGPTFNHDLCFLRVCNVDEEGRFGGPERRIVQVAHALKQYNIKTHVVYPVLDSEAFEKHLSDHNISATKLNITRLSKHRKLLTRYIVRFGIEIIIMARFFAQGGFHVVHVNGSYQFKVAVAAKLARVPVLWHLNDTFAPRILKGIFNIIAKICADGFIVAGERVNQYYLANTELHQLPLLEVHAPVDLNKFNPLLFGENKDTKDNTLCVGTVSGLNPAKGVEYFIEMAAKLIAIYPAVRFVVAGAILDSQKAYSAMIEEKLNLLGLSGHVEFSGFVHDVPKFLSEVDICVFTSITEASPTSVWEALAMAKPVVTTNVGSVSQYILDGVSGFIVPPRDVNKLTQRTMQLVADKNLRERMGAEARRVAVEKLGIDAAAEMHNSIYRQITGCC